MIDQLLDPSSPPQWGLRLNFYEGRYNRKSSLPEGCPAWANPMQQHDWREEELVVWNNATQQLEALRPWEALALLERLRASETWKAEGDRIEKCSNWSYLDGTFAKSSRNAAHQGSASEPRPTTKEPRIEKSYREIVPLSPQACQAVMQFLQTHEHALLGLAQAEEDRAFKALEDVYKMLFQSHRNSELEEIQLAQRTLPWTRVAGKTDIICDTPPNRATLTLTEGFFPFWYVCIERPHHFKHESPRFVKLTEALDWAEKELIAAQNIQETVEEKETFPASTMDLGPYEIAPAALEPAQVRYRAVIDVQREPIRSKKYEMSFGEAFVYDKEYPTALQLAHELKLDAERINVEEVVKGMGWYRIFTLTDFYVESLAISQTQQLWDRSAIVQEYQAKHIAWARYGYEETETGYTVFLGGCESPDHASPKPQSRAEYMAEEAKRLTLIYALDVVGFRAYLHLSKKWQSDDQLLRCMREQRAGSHYIPIAAREDSRRWLKEHPATTR